MKKEPKKQEKSHLESVTDRVGEIAVNYGFTVIKTPQINSGDISKSKQFKDYDYYGDVEEKVALTRWYIEAKLDNESQPIAIHYKKPFSGSGKKKKPSKEIYGLEIMGSGRPTSEALILKSTLAILAELGYTNLYVDINSIGDKESIAKFDRELHGHLRKHAHSLSSKVRETFKKDLYSMLKIDSDEVSEFSKSIPQPISSLSDISRLHFKEVLESLEAFEAMYKIKPNILSNKHYASYTIFEIRQQDGASEASTDPLVAYGYRYNYLAKKLGAKREIPSIGVTIFAKKNSKMGKKVLVKNIKKPRFYLVQLGNTAKIKALNVVEMLRKNKIPVHHSITKDKIGGQLNGAEYMKSTHVLIMGQKEAIENSMVVRSIANREQETIPLVDLVHFLKNIDKKKR